MYCVVALTIMLYASKAANTVEVGSMYTTRGRMRRETTAAGNILGLGGNPTDVAVGKGSKRDLGKGEFLMCRLFRTRGTGKVRSIGCAFGPRCGGFIYCVIKRQVRGSREGMARCRIVSCVRSLGARRARKTRATRRGRKTCDRCHIFMRRLEDRLREGKGANRSIRIADAGTSGSFRVGKLPCKCCVVSRIATMGKAGSTTSLYVMDATGPRVGLGVGSSCPIIAGGVQRSSRRSGIKGRK